MVTSSLHTICEQRWNDETDVKHEEYRELVRIVLQKAFSLYILHGVLPNRAVFGQTRYRFFAVVKDKWAKFIFAKNRWWQIMCSRVFMIFATLTIHYLQINNEINFLGKNCDSSKSINERRIAIYTLFVICCSIWWKCIASQSYIF